MLRSERYTSKYLNKVKFDFLCEVDSYVLKMKNEISTFCKSNIFKIINKNKDFSKQDKLFQNEFLSAWETQAVFQDICKFYENHVQQKISNFNFKTQKSMKIEFYKIGKRKGTVKNFELEYNKSSSLSKLLKYLLYLENPKHIKNPEIQNFYDYYKEKGLENRILNLVNTSKQRLLKSVKLIEFTTGTYRKCFNEAGNKDKQGNVILSNGFIEDTSNSLYKHWFKCKIRKQNLFLPIQINKDYHNVSKLEKSQFFVKRNKNKFDFIALKEVQNPQFHDFKKVEGLDLNVKNNFCTLSNGNVFDYDRTYIKEFVNELKKLDKIGLKNISNLQQRRLNKLVKKNEWYFKKLIHDILDEVQNQDITDLVIEELSSFSKTFIKSEKFDVKYSRLVRLLRLSNIKTWLNNQAEKRGIRVHLTTPRYTSQQCPLCGHIDRENRKSQEEFECLQCGYAANADKNSGDNLKNRYTLDVLRLKLHNQDEFGRLIPKKLGKEKIKEILESVVEKSNVGLNLTFPTLGNHESSFKIGNLF